MSADRMSPLDATFLHAEDRVSHMHIGSVGILEGPPPAHDDHRTASRRYPPFRTDMSQRSDSA